MFSPNGMSDLSHMSNSTYMSDLSLMFNPNDMSNSKYISNLSLMLNPNDMFNSKYMSKPQPHVQPQ